MSCIVCDQPDGLGCEFCPSEPEFISNRDPGDENDYRPPAPVSARSYTATYRIGDVHFTRTILGADSFLLTVDLAIDNAPEGAILVGLKELS